MDFPVSNRNLFRDKKKNLCLSLESVYDDYRTEDKKKSWRITVRTKQTVFVQTPCETYR